MRTGREGKAWEMRLETYHKAYKAFAGAHVVHCHPGVKEVAGKLIYDSKGPPDFKGEIRGGRAVSFDAKEVAHGGALPFKNIRPHQADDLDWTRVMGGIAFIAVLFKDYANGTELEAIFPWTEELGLLYLQWVNKDPGAVASVSYADYGVPMSATGWLDWAKEQG